MSVALTSLDYALLAILLLSAVLGLLRGLFREVMSLAVWIAAVWLASRYAWWLSPQLAELVPNEALRTWVARLLVLMGVLLSGALLTWALSSALHGTSLGGPDRVLGLVFGMARGLFLAAVAVAVLRLAGFTDEPWWRQSKLVPYAAPAADMLREAAEQGLGRQGSRS